jgi:adenine-specific DNA-methyltransferase
MPTLQFKGKTFVQNHHLAVPYHQLLPQKDKSLTEKISLNDNLIVQGDNLLALKALLPTYTGRVKCIYIDPPYNTGNEGWVYSDNVKSPIIKEWIGKVVGKADEDLVRHDKWLCMMMPRLKLLRELLAKDGVLFISIDEHEVGYLSALVKEIFGDNSVDYLVWRKTGKQSNTKIIHRVKTTHEYVLVIYKNKIATHLSKVMLLPNWATKKSNPDNDPRGDWESGIISKHEDKSNTSSDNFYSIVLPSGRRLTREFYVDKDKFDKLRSDNRIYFPKDGDGIPRLKIFENEEQEYFFDTIMDEMGTFTDARAEIEEILGSKDIFETPKPSKMIKELIRSSTHKNDIILDSFAGSGTTAQAVLELNKEDGGNRKFILVEMENYANSITAERVRRVMKGVPKSKNKLIQEGLGHSFSYFELGEAIEMESLLSGKSLPKFTDLARYLFYTATGEEFKPEVIDKDTHFIGSTNSHVVFAYYKPDLEYLKTTSLTLDEAKRLRKLNGNKPLLVFAPTKYVEQQTLDELSITFCQLPFEIYRMKK